MQKIRKNRLLTGLFVLMIMFSLTGCGSEEPASDIGSFAAAEQTKEPVSTEKDSEELSAESASEESIPEEETEETAAEAPEETTWQSISQDEAKRIMAEESGFIILDVRRQDEYDEGHIPGAVCIPNESIGTEEIPELPDKNQTILVYCRSGRRSKEASEKLAALGYSGILEFGGIIDWTGEVVAEQKLGNLQLLISGKEMPVSWADNASVEELSALVSDGELTIEMSMYGGFEQVGHIGAAIERADVQTATSAGDIVLYAGNQIVVFYGSNTWEYTYLGHIHLPEEEIKELLGKEDVTLILKTEET